MEDKHNEEDSCFCAGSDRGYGYGCLPENSVQQVYTSYQQGAASLSLFLSVYQQNMPAIPLLYRQGLVICEEYVKADILSNPAEAFAEIA